jgi:hypothetical protein
MCSQTPRIQPSDGHGTSVRTAQRQASSAVGCCHSAENGDTGMGQHRRSSAESRADWAELFAFDRQRWRADKKDAVRCSEAGMSK